MTSTNVGVSPLLFLLLSGLGREREREFFVLTNTSEDKGYEEPCCGPEHLVQVERRGQEEQNDEEDRGGLGWLVAVEVVCLFGNGSGKHSIVKHVDHQESLQCLLVRRRFREE
jgi:hypothetical protein